MGAASLDAAGLHAAGLQVGHVVAERYHLERKLGEGGFGSVWLAGDARAGQGGPQRPEKVALKVLHPHLRGAGDGARRFEREIRVLLTLDHPAIARALDWSLDGPHAYVALEYVEGVSLKRLVAELAKSSGHFAIEDVRVTLAELCSAVDHAHAHGVVHRDLKPANVLVAIVDGHLRLKVLDFGIARLLESDATDRTTVGRMVGSPAYLAPEQIESRDVDQRSDVFALGCILFELLTSRRIWHKDALGAPARAGAPNLPQDPANARVMLLERIRRGPRPRASDWREELPRSVDAVLARALAPDPADRFSSAAALLEAFESALDHPEDTLPLGPELASGDGTPASLEAEVEDEGSMTAVMPVGLAEGRPLGGGEVPAAGAPPGDGTGAGTSTKVDRPPPLDTPTAAPALAPRPVQLGPRRGLRASARLTETLVRLQSATGLSAEVVIRRGAPSWGAAAVVVALVLVGTISTVGLRNHLRGRTAGAATPAPRAALRSGAADRVDPRAGTSTGGGLDPGASSVSPASVSERPEVVAHPLGEPARETAEGRGGLERRSEAARRPAGTAPGERPASSERRADPSGRPGTAPTGGDPRRAGAEASGQAHIPGSDARGSPEPRDAGPGGERAAGVRQLLARVAEARAHPEDRSRLGDVAEGVRAQASELPAGRRAKVDACLFRLEMIAPSEAWTVAERCIHLLE